MFQDTEFHTYIPPSPNHDVINLYNSVHYNSYQLLKQ